MKNRDKLIRIIKLILESENRILKIRGGRGYGVGHPVIFKGKVSTHLGPQDAEEEPQQKTTRVKISKAFKNKHGKAIRCIQV